MDANSEKTRLGSENTLLGYGKTFQGFRETMQGSEKTLQGSEKTLLPFEKNRRVFRGFWLGLGRTFLAFGSLALDVAAMRLGGG